MGLDTTHDCWHGPYSSFNNFRRDVAKSIGVDLDSMEGFGGNVAWGSLPPDPLHVLLNHSDCDGSILSKDCAALAARLREIAPSLPEHPDRKWQADRFASGLELAAEHGEDVEFH